MSVGAAHRAQRELDMPRGAVLAPRGELPVRLGVGKHTVEQGFIAAQQQCRERAAGCVVLSKAEVRAESGVHVGHRSSRTGGIHERERDPARTERCSR